MAAGDMKIDCVHDDEMDKCGDNPGQLGWTLDWDGIDI